MLGDAYAEQKKNDDALGYYKKAVDAAFSEKDEGTLFLCFIKSGFILRPTGKTKEAIDIFNK
jgi:hypothetical protein